MSNIPSILDDAKFRHLLLEQNQLIESSLVGIAGFNLPAYDEVNLSGYVATDKPSTIVLKSGGTTVATLTLSYDGSNNVTSIVRS
jgi:hypothetical protein